MKTTCPHLGSFSNALEMNSTPAKFSSTELPNKLFDIVRYLASTIALSVPDEPNRISELA
jgi:hypothetical protein